MEIQNNIVLLGMPSSGKTTLGKQLATDLGREFIDLDQLIEEAEARSIPEIFEKEGEAYFRKQEAKILSKVLNRTSKYVLSAGGGTPCFYDGIEKIREKSLSIFIDVSPEELSKRILEKGNDGRPLLADKKENELLQSLELKIKDRRQYYERAHISLHNDDLALKILVRSIKAYVTLGKK